MYISQTTKRLQVPMHSCQVSVRHHLYIDTSVWIWRLCQVEVHCNKTDTKDMCPTVLVR